MDRAQGFLFDLDGTFADTAPDLAADQAFADQRADSYADEKAHEEQGHDRLFGAEHANVQPHAGAQANMAVYFAPLSPGDKVLGLSLDHGGPLTHGLKRNFSRRLDEFHPSGGPRATRCVVVLSAAVAA